ncbi:MAG: hypothetical protein HFF39_05370 [Lawsonibacter sp.]|nr:hypothetical protein [Lawsonibacter sp.]MCI9155361.1 hypothetical protein [Lawsonibacter sp.]
MGNLIRAEDSLGVVISQICRDLCGINGTAIDDVFEYAQDAIRRRSGFRVHFQRQPSFGRFFPSWERPWIGGNRTLRVTCYADGSEDDLVNNPQHFFEQLGLGIVLAHIPDFIDDYLTPSVTLQSFRRDYPQYADLGDKVCAVLKSMVRAN